MRAFLYTTVRAARYTHRHGYDRLCLGKIGLRRHQYRSRLKPLNVPYRYTIYTEFASSFFYHLGCKLHQRAPLFPSLLNAPPRTLADSVSRFA